MNKQGLLVAVLALGVGAGSGYWYAQGVTEQINQPAVSASDKRPRYYRHPMNPSVTSPKPMKDEMGMDYVPVYAEEPRREPLYYRHPMNPSVTSPVPAKDEMGMDYVPVYAEGEAAGGPAGTVQIDPVTVQNIGVRTAPVESRALSRIVQAVGRVGYDEERVTRLHPKTEGWIQKLFVDKTGDQVTRDTVLLSIYSPKLVISQQEFLVALTNLESLDALEGTPYEDIRRSALDMVKTSRQRLRLLDVPEHQIRELEQSRKIKQDLHIHSPFDGVVLRIGAREGQHVTARTQLYLLADLSKVWVYVDIYEHELPWVRIGDEAEMRLAGIPGRVFRGQVAYIYPFAASKTRTIKVRLEFDNPDLALKPEMFAEVSIHASRRVDAVVIPSQAVVRSGAREQVFVVRGPGKFAPREVRLGVTSNGFTQVLEGVSPGEEVVTSALFLIDSESKLREATAKMREVAPSAVTGSTDESARSNEQVAPAPHAGGEAGRD